MWWGRPAFRGKEVFGHCKGFSHAKSKEQICLMRSRSLLSSLARRSTDVQNIRQYKET